MFVGRAALQQLCITKTAMCCQMIKPDGITVQHSQSGHEEATQELSKNCMLPSGATGCERQSAGGPSAFIVALVTS
jgi:hypothetical protein